MDVSIIGAGNMARGIGSSLVAGGHHAVFYDRDKEQAINLAKELLQGKDDLLAEGKEYGETLVGDMVILAVPYGAVAEVIADYKTELPGKIVVDITNPVDFATFELLPPPGSSGAEEIAAMLPDNTPVVKAFNTTFAGTLLQGQINDIQLDVFVAGDDNQAKETVKQLITDGGFRALDAGPLARARALEAMQLIHMSLQEQLGSNWMSTIKIIA